MRREMVAKIAIDVSDGANAIVHALVGVHAADPAVNGSCVAWLRASSRSRFWDRQHRREMPAWLADRQRVGPIVSRLEHDAGIRIADVLPAAKLQL